MRVNLETGEGNPRSELGTNHRIGIRVGGVEGEEGEEGSGIRTVQV